MTEDVQTEPKTGRNVAPNIVPGKNGGYLIPGWKQPGPGRPPDELRRRSREGFESWLARLEAIEQGGRQLSVSEISKALDVLGKFGLGEKKFELDESSQLEHCALWTAEFLLAKGVPQWYEEWVAGLKARFESL